MKKIGKCSCCFLILYTQYIRYFNYNLNFFFLEPPKVRVNYKETFPGITTLYCRAHGFYPPEISINWMKNGEEIVQDTNYGGILPSGDGTYQTWVSVELDSQNGDIYSCHVEHGGVHMVLPGFQGKAGVVAAWVVRLRKGGEQEPWITVCFGTGLLNQRFSQLFGPRAPLYSKNYWGPQRAFVYVSYIYFYLLYCKLNIF